MRGLVRSPAACPCGAVGAIREKLVHPDVWPYRSRFANGEAMAKLEDDDREMKERLERLSSALDAKRNDPQSRGEREDSSTVNTGRAMKPFARHWV